MSRTIRNIQPENEDHKEIKYLKQQQNKSDRKSSRGKWKVRFRESECGWGSDEWDIFYDSFDKAKKAQEDCNKQNTLHDTPDYYICAYDPIFVSD